MRTNNEMSVMLDHGRSISSRERNCVFLNTGADARAAGRFACVSAASGLDFPDDGRGVSVVDWDGDGDQDVWMSNRNAPRVRFMRNDTAGVHNFVTLLLVGNGITTSRDAIGARVELTFVSTASDGHSTPRSVIRSVRAGDAFLSQSTRWLQFGLGTATEISKITVRWPGGEQEAFTDFDLNKRYRLHQGGTVAEQAMPRDILPVLTPSVPKLPPPASRFRVPLVALLPMPDLPYIGPFGERKNLLDGLRGPRLVNCWSTTCAPCLKELKDFTDHADELRAAGIEVIAMSLDEVDGAGAASDASRTVLNTMGFPFATGKATREMGLALNVLHSVLTATGGQLPVPTSFLIDAEGRLAAIYKGPVSMETLMDDVANSSLSPVERFRRSASFPGRLIDDEVLEKAIVKGDRFARTRLIGHLQELGMLHAASIQNEAMAKNLPESEDKQAILGKVLLDQGVLLARQQRWTAAVDSFTKAIEHQADSEEAHYNLGVAYQRLKRLDLAQQHYERAIELQPTLISAHANLARLLSRQKQWSDAAPHFEVVVHARPKDAESHYNFGVTLANQSQWQRAAEQFEIALQLRPDFPQAQSRLERAKAHLSE